MYIVLCYVFWCSVFYCIFILFTLIFTVQALLLLYYLLSASRRINLFIRRGHSGVSTPTMRKLLLLIGYYILLLLLLLMYTNRNLIQFL